MAEAGEDLLHYVQSDPEHYDPLDDDELEHEDLTEKNQDLAPYPGVVQDGVIVPVGFPTMFSMPIPEVGTHIVDIGAVNSDAADGKAADSQEKAAGEAAEGKLPAPTPTLPSESVFENAERRRRNHAKDEPVEAVLAPAPAEPAAAKTEGSPDALYMPKAGEALKPLLFPPRTAARHVLASADAPLFMQLPGIVPLRENRSAWPGATAAAPGAADRKRDGAESAETIVAAARERERGLATDLRVVNAPGEIKRIGKLYFYKSGRVLLKYEDGSSADVTVGAACKNVQQLVCVSTKPKDAAAASAGAKAEDVEDKMDEGDDGANEDDEDDDNVCEELNASIRSRLVCIPTLDTLISTKNKLPAVKKQDSRLAR